jgi:outer membrane protein OmpA-like peptidoglycan-associated protein
MAANKPMLGDIELQQVQTIEVDEDQVLAQQSVPALEGDFLQRLGRRGTQISLTGVLTGAEAGAGLKTLQEKFRAAAAVSFVADIATATQVEKVLIEEMGIRELAGKPSRFEYALTLREFIPPPAPEPVTPPPPTPPPPSVETGTLVVEVTVEGQPGFDFSKVTVSVEGTQDDGTSLTRTLTNRSNNSWTEENMPPGKYTVKAVVTDPAKFGGSAEATVSTGQTAQTAIRLNPASNIARTFIVHFRFDKAFVEPCMRRVLMQAATYAQTHPDEKLVIVGHTDLTGPDAYNQSLSERRARSVFAYLTFGGDDAAQTAALDEWNTLRLTRPQGEQPSIKDNWGVREYQHILQDLGFYSGNVDGQEGPLTQSAVRAYRCKKGLPPGTTVDDQTWEELIKDYLSQDPLSFSASQFLPNCSGEILKWLGCGEKDPVKNTRAAWRPNRRTELLFVQASQLPCKVPQPDTFDLPTPGTVNSSWCLGPGDKDQRSCFVTPAKAPCTTGTADHWCRQPVEPDSITVQGSIKRELLDGSLVPAAKQKFVLLTPDGQFKASEQSNGEPQPARTDDNGNFSFSDQRIGFYSLAVVGSVLVRLAEQGDDSVKGNAVCKRLSSNTDHLDVVIINAPVLREIKLPTVAHLMTALHPLTREIRTCPSQGGPPALQATAHTDDEIRTAFDGANKIWRQARIRFDLVDIVHETYSFRTDCEIDDAEFTILLQRCAYPGAINVFFVGDLTGTSEAGVGVSPEGGAALNVAGCAIGDRFQITILQPAVLDQPLNEKQTVQILAHELGHYLNLDHADNTPANAHRLMLPGTLTGDNRTVTKDEVNHARASRGAAIDCITLSLHVSGAGVIPLGGTLSHEFIVVVNPFDSVIVDAEISDALLTIGTFEMTGGDPGANNKQRTITVDTEGVTEVKASYTPTSGGRPFTTSVVIRAVTFILRVDGADPVAPGSSTFIACPDSSGVVTIVAEIDPAPFCIPTNLVTWTNGVAKPDPLRRTISKTSVSSTTVKAKLTDVEQSVTIEIREVLLTNNTAPFQTGVKEVQIEGLLNQQLAAPDKKVTRAKLFTEQTDSFFRARVCVSGVSGNTVTAILISKTPGGAEIERITLTLTRTTNNIFVSDPILAVPSALPRAELDKVTFVDFKVIRAQAGGKMRLQRTEAVTNTASFSEVTVKGRVLYIFAQTFTDAHTTAKDLKATAEDIRRQLRRANRVWAQAGLEVKERKIQDSVPAPPGLLQLDHNSNSPTLTDDEQKLVGLKPGGPSYSTISTDLNVFYVEDITSPALGVSYKSVVAPGHRVIALKGPRITDAALSHEIGHQMLVNWAGVNSNGQIDEHVDLSGHDWPETNVLHRTDVDSAKDVDKTQAQNILAGIKQHTNPFVVFEP